MGKPLSNVKDLTREELESDLVQAGHPSYRARQIFSWLYKRAVREFSEMTDLPEPLRAHLAKRFSIGTEHSVRAGWVSSDGTRKFALLLRDDAMVETALIPSHHQYSTACLSTQVGCKYACAFCASGRDGFARNLTCGEIVEQLLFLKRLLPGEKITHIVFMGVGEPLDNYEQTLKAARRINSPDALGIAARRITISTCGIVPGIRKLATEKMQFELSVSLHAADPETRSRIMPVNRRYPAAELIAACREYTAVTGRIVTFEYVLLEGLNAGDADADRLAGLLSKFKCKVNLIPGNKVAGMDCEGVTVKEAREFAARLRALGVSATVRTPMGRDIEAACGQLRWRLMENKRTI